MIWKAYPSHLFSGFDCIIDINKKIKDNTITKKPISGYSSTWWLILLGKNQLYHKALKSSIHLLLLSVKKSINTVHRSGSDQMFFPVLLLLAEIDYINFLLPRNYNNGVLGIRSKQLIYKGVMQWSKGMKPSFWVDRANECFYKPSWAI